MIKKHLPDHFVFTGYLVEDARSLPKDDYGERCFHRPGFYRETLKNRNGKSLNMFSFLLGDTSFWLQTVLCIMYLM